MGMAASQARYLSLSARKTNTEYEGQQLNQQRLNLANQTADLFNQMLSMSVPQCPDSNDFTKLQYAWSDGVNDEIISDFYQIATPNEDYNYVVTSYHYENVYTGQSKKMNSPEIQSTRTNKYETKPNKEYFVKQLTYKQESSAGAADDTYTVVVNRNGVESTRVFRRADIQDSFDAVDEVDAVTGRTNKAIAGENAHHNEKYGYVDSHNNEKGRYKTSQWYFDSDITVSLPNTAFSPTKEATEHEAYDATGAYTGNPMFVDVTIESAGEQLDALETASGGKIDRNLSLSLGYAARWDDTTTPGKVVYLKADGTDAADETEAAKLTGIFKQVDFDDETQKEIYDQLQQTYGARYDVNETYYYYDTGIDTGHVDSDGNKLTYYAFIAGSELDNAKGSQGETAMVDVRGGDKTTYYTDGISFLTGAELGSIDLTDPANPVNQLFFHQVENFPTYTNFTAVGNSALTEVSLASYKDDQDIRIEIEQVLRDMKKNNNDVAVGNLSACFNPDTGEYLGGIYSFKMYGHTYYTTTSDLEQAAASAYREKATASNGIDSQVKFMYYTSTYIQQKIEDTKKALMETDGKGRFTTVKFEDDDTVYTLSCETVTDEDAYNNAMNKYFYDQEKYDKGIADINARTEIIQAQDRELQLRLEQLGTEQTALQTEMEAVQKVVQKSIESSFKTFGG